MDKEFLANLQQEGDPVNLDELSQEQPAESERGEKETPPESPPETKPETEPESPPEEEEGDEKGEAPPEEGEEPVVYHSFDKHPRWIAREQELKELREQNEELAAFRERAEPILEQIEKTPREESKAMPQWAEDIGWDDNTWNKYREHGQAERRIIKEELLSELKPFMEAAEKSKEQTALDDWASKEWETLEKDPDISESLKKLGLKLDEKVQDEILGVVTKYLPTDEKTGNLSVTKGFELWKELKSSKTPSPSPATEEKKKVADKTIKKSTATEEEKDFKTSADFKGKSFADLSR